MVIEISTRMHSQWLKQCGFAATIFLATDRIRETPVRIEGCRLFDMERPAGIASRGNAIWFPYRDSS